MIDGERTVAVDIARTYRGVNAIALGFATATDVYDELLWFVECPGAAREVAKAVARNTVSLPPALVGQYKVLTFRPEPWPWLDEETQRRIVEALTRTRG